ncbi:uncharacterized protein LOC124643645 [Helicoverpa zea]|uniref:uncharacterized protein LOC124643645 n=1 Tax=Helicoverpa zea TaxID=7113 RepID=UPI001F59AF95|nr:uncharacterized protein LOC124643645 [Helicoverpa zea]
MFLLEIKILLFISNREEFKKSYLLAKTVLLEIMKSASLSKELIKKLQMMGSQLKRALLEFDWTSMHREDKNNYLIIISYMKKELRIKTAFDNDLCLVTMTSLLKASYQACALLRTMDI